jgi:hypothetical protein
MASGFTQKGKLEIANQALNLVTEPNLKLVLVDNTYVHNNDTDFVGAALGVGAKEISVSGYVGGFGGAGRRVPAGRGLSRDDAADEIEFDFTDEVWTALGAGVTIGGVALIVEKTNDADSWVVAYDELTGDVPTNGGNITYQPSAEGMLKF